MLFQAVVLFFPISIFFKNSSKRLKVHSDTRFYVGVVFILKFDRSSQNDLRKFNSRKYYIIYLIILVV